MLEKLSKIQSILSNDQPITRIFSKETYMSDKERDELRRRVNPIFENFNGDKTFYTNWAMCYPKMVDHQKCSLYSILRELQGRGDTEQEKSLGKLSNYLDQLRVKITLKQATETEYLIYLTIIDTLSGGVKNNNVAFNYEIPPDNDGINPVNFDTYEVISSDDYDFEYINVLLSLLSFYSYHMLNGATLKLKLENTQKCIDTIRLIYAKCEIILDRNEKESRCIYKRSPSSISSEPPKSVSSSTDTTPITTTTTTTTTNTIDIRLFIEFYLGGLSSINARFHLFNAKFYELLHTMQAMEKNEYLEDLTDIMGSVIDSYKTAYDYANEHNPSSKLTGYCRFMYYLWQCEANYFLASSLSKDTEQGLRGEALQRLVFIKSLYDTYRSTVKTTFLIGEELREQRYRKVIQDTNVLHQVLNKEFCELMIMPPPVDFVIQKLTRIYTSTNPLGLVGLIPEFTPLIEIINNVYSSAFIVTHNHLYTALQQFIITLSSTRSKLISRPNERNIMNVIPPDEKDNTTIPSIINTTTTTTTQESHEFTLFDKLEDVDSAKIGMLKERELWLKHLIGLYKNEQKEFIICPQNYDIYKQELARVHVVMTMHSNNLNK